MSYSKRSEETKSAPKPYRRARNWADKPLSARQKSALAMLAKTAFGIQFKAGLVEGGKEADWRREQVEIACGAKGLRKCENKHYRAVYARLQMLAGNETEAQKFWAKTGRVQGSDEVGDTHEERESALAVLREVVEKGKGFIDEAYVDAIARDQFREFREHGLDGLRASQLQSLVFVVVQRLREKDPDVDL